VYLWFSGSVLRADDLDISNKFHEDRSARAERVVSEMEKEVKSCHAGGGIRTHVSLRNRILSPAPLSSSATPALFKSI
jgi:hypothetical protein